MATEYRSSDDIPGNGEFGTTIDPSAIDTAGTGAPEPATTGRKRRSDAGKSRGAKGTGESKKTNKVSLDLSSLTGMFIGFHAILAERTDTPELAMSEEEGKEFMTRVQNVMRHYSIETSQKSIDMAALIGSASAIWGSRFMAVSFRRRAEREQKNQPQQNIVPFPNVSNVVTPGPYNPEYVG